MAASMRTLWGAPPHPKLAQKAQENSEQVQSLIEFCGGELTRRGARKLLADYRGDTMAALNAYMDMPASQSKLLNVEGPPSDDEDEQPDIPPFEVPLPEGLEKCKPLHPLVIDWIKGQCAALGCKVNISFSRKRSRSTTTPDANPSPSSHLPRPRDSHPGLALLQSSTTRTLSGIQMLMKAVNHELLGPKGVFTPTGVEPRIMFGVPVWVERPFAEAIYQRERKADDHLLSLESQILEVQHAGGLAWNEGGWCRPSSVSSSSSRSAAEECGLTVVNVKSGLSRDNTLVPAPLLSFNPSFPFLPKKGKGVAKVVPEGDTTKDKVVKHAAAVAISKITVFSRKGRMANEEWLQAILRALEGRFLDTQIGYMRIRGGYRFVVCGLGMLWVRNWLTGRMMTRMPVSLKGLRSEAPREIERRTGCIVIIGSPSGRTWAPLSSSASWGDDASQEEPVQWMWRCEGKWAPFTSRDSAAIEKAHREGKEKFTLHSSTSKAYIINFREMTQTNQTTRRTRSIRRGNASSPNKEMMEVVYEHGGEDKDLSAVMRQLPSELLHELVKSAEGSLGSLLMGNEGGSANDQSGREGIISEDALAAAAFAISHSHGMGTQPFESMAGLASAAAMSASSDTSSSGDTAAPSTAAAAATAAVAAVDEGRGRGEDDAAAMAELQEALALSVQEASQVEGGGDGEQDSQDEELAKALLLSRNEGLEEEEDGEEEDEEDEEEDGTDAEELAAALALSREQCAAAAQASPKSPEAKDVGDEETASEEMEVNSVDSFSTDDSDDKESVWIATVGPVETRTKALVLLEKEKQVREEVLRMLPSMKPVIDSRREEIQEHTRCRSVKTEGDGMVHIVGTAHSLKKARVALEKFVQMWQVEEQKIRLMEVTREMVSELCRVEVRVPIPERLQKLLSQPLGMFSSGSKKESSSGAERYRIDRKSEKKGQNSDEAAQAQIMWVTLDEFAMDTQKQMKTAGVHVPPEWTTQGAMLGIYVGDRIANIASFEGTTTQRKAAAGSNAPGKEEGKVTKIDPWLAQEQGNQRHGLDVFMRTVTDWLRCTCEQNIADPGRPSLVFLEAEWEIKKTRGPRGHYGMWRQDSLTIFNYWCSSPTHRDWPYCEHSGHLRTPHWSCCGEKPQTASCTKSPSNTIRVGSRVKVRADVVEPKYKWGAVSRSDVGVVVKMDKDGKCIVDFEKDSSWTGHLPDLELVPCDLQKGTIHNPAMGFLRRLRPDDSDTPITSWKEADQRVARGALELVHQKWLLIADLYLLQELQKVFTPKHKDTSTIAELRTQHSHTQRARHRIREMRKDAEKVTAETLGKLHATRRHVVKLCEAETTGNGTGDGNMLSNKDGVALKSKKEVDTTNHSNEDDKEKPGPAAKVALLEKFIDQAQEHLKEWLQELSAAEFDVERQMFKLRRSLEAKERNMRKRRTPWDVIQHISEISGAFIDYRPPNLHLRVSGHEANVRNAIQQLQWLTEEGAQGLEKLVTIPIKPELADRLKANGRILLQLVQRHSRIQEVTLRDDNTLELLGMEKQVEQALRMLNITEQPKHDEYATALLTQPSAEWGRQYSVIPSTDAKVCCACMVETEEPIWELLCGHPVHSSCLVRWVNACIDRSLGMTGEVEGPGAVAVCPMHGGGGGCPHELTTREFCEIVGGKEATEGGRELSVLENMQQQIERRIPTHDRIRKCPGCAEWVVASVTCDPVVCSKCRRAFCPVRGTARCGGQPHYFSSCEQFAKARISMLRRRGHDVPAEIEALGQMPDNCVPCAKCQAWIMREEDLGQRCRYMVCRECMYEFCWLCLQPAVNHKHVYPPEANKRGSPECDPENRDERRKQLMTKVQECHQVMVWPNCTSCSRCGKRPITATEVAYCCLQCPNSYLCEACEPQGCPSNPDHVLDDLPRTSDRRKVYTAPTPSAPLQLPHDDDSNDGAQLPDLEIASDFWRQVNEIVGPADDDDKAKGPWRCTICSFCNPVEEKSCGGCGGAPVDDQDEGGAVASPPAQTKKTNWCSADHEMVISSYAKESYEGGWVCNGCGQAGSGSRWFCRECSEDYCFSCLPKGGSKQASRLHFINLLGLEDI